MAADPSRTPEPQWHPLSAMPLIAQLIDDSLEEAHTLNTSYRTATQKPYSLNDEIVQKAKKLSAETEDFLWIWSEQLRRWRNDRMITSLQKKEIERLEHQLSSLKKTVKSNLSLLQELETVTIERLHEKSDIDIGIEAVMRMFRESET